MAGCLGFVGFLSTWGGITPHHHHHRLLHPLHFSLTEKKFYLFCHPQNQLLKFFQIN